MFDEFFGGMFDFNGDGHIDFLEEATSFAIIDEMTKEEKLEEFDIDSNSDDFDY